MLTFCAMKNRGPLGKPTLVSSDVSATLDSGPPNKHFSSSLLPFELGVGSLPNRWLAVWELGFLFSFPSSAKENSSSSFQSRVNTWADKQNCLVKNSL